ncbi:MAG: hypothetical protein R3C01_10055 [Planctomycetaceae bacterium]
MKPALLPQIRSRAEALSRRQQPLAADMRDAAELLSQGRFAELELLLPDLESYREEFTKTVEGLREQALQRAQSHTALSDTTVQNGVFGSSLPASFPSATSSLQAVQETLSFEEHCAASLDKIQQLRNVTSTLDDDPALDVIANALDALEQQWRTAERGVVDDRIDSPELDSPDVETHPLWLLREFVEQGATLPDNEWLGLFDDLRDTVGGTVIAAATRQRLTWASNTNPHTK